MTIKRVSAMKDKRLPLAASFALPCLEVRKNSQVSSFRPKTHKSACFTELRLDWSLLPDLPRSFV